MLDIDVGTLRLMTAEAEVNISQCEQAAEEAGHLDAWRAQLIVGQMTDVLKARANLGLNWALVMDLAESDYDKYGENYDEGSFNPDWLIGHAALVYSHCLAVGLSANIIFWHNFELDRTGFSITVHW